MKTLGIVVPIYNAESYLEKCINSIINQTYGNIKIALVNDGSTDKSGLICNKYADLDERIVVLHQKNQGKLKARYNGLKKIECDYATYVDADDWINEDIYEKLSCYMEMNIDIISFSIIRYKNEQNQYISYENFPSTFYQRKDIVEKIFSTMIWDLDRKGFGLDPSLCNKLFKRELLLSELESAKELNISYGDDCAVIYPAMLRCNSLQITEFVGYYHRQRDSKQIAPYIEDKDYYKKLLRLYEYLVMRMPDFIKQLDYMFAEEAFLHLKIYGEKLIRYKYLFPFDKIKKDEKIILYGAGAVGKTYCEQIKKINYARIIAWVDKNYEIYEELKVEPPRVILEREYDYVVIAISNPIIQYQIKDYLLYVGVEEKKIIC